MSLEKANIAWSCKQVKSMILKGTIDLNHIIQRSYVWEKSRKSALIESLIIGYPVPPIYAKRAENGDDRTYFVMDGKQRLDAITQFLNNGYELVQLNPVQFDNDETGEVETVDISGKKFDDLPEQLQDKLNTTMINVVYFTNLSKEEERELFKRLNAGKPLSAKSRVLASCKDIEEILNISEHEIFAEMLTDKAISNKNQVGLVMKAWSMLNQDIDEVSFESKKFNPMIEETKISDEQKVVLNEVFDFAIEIHGALIDKDKKIAKKFYTETHFVSFVPFIYKADKLSISADLFADFVYDFLANEPENYKNASGSGSAKNVNIKVRHNVILEKFEKFFLNETDAINE